MKKRSQKKARVFLPVLLIVTFVLCGVAGAYCPMSFSAAASHSSQSASPHSPSDNHRKCPEQLSNAPEQFKKLTAIALPVIHFHLLDSFTHTTSQKLLLTHITQPSAYPLLFLRFSVLLN